MIYKYGFVNIIINSIIILLSKNFLPKDIFQKYIKCDFYVTKIENNFGLNNRVFTSKRNIINFW